MIRPRIELIVARADNGVIGKDGAMPWHLPADLRHFKVTTMGAPMIMGRKTFESLPGLLPSREHIVLTRDSRWTRKGAIVVHSREEALARAAGDRASVIGGAEIYREFLPLADRIHLTEVHVSPEGDTVFPQLNQIEWDARRGNRQGAEGDAPAHTFVTLTRKGALSSG
jgi:dihydrofolate reductase